MEKKIEQKSKIESVKQYWSYRSLDYQALIEAIRSHIGFMSKREKKKKIQKNQKITEIKKRIYSDTKIVDNLMIASLFWFCLYQQHLKESHTIMTLPLCFTSTNFVCINAFFFYPVQTLILLLLNQKIHLNIRYCSKLMKQTERCRFMDSLFI